MGHGHDARRGAWGTVRGAWGTVRGARPKGSPHRSCSRACSSPASAPCHQLTGVPPATRWVQVAALGAPGPVPAPARSLRAQRGQAPPPPAPRAPRGAPGSPCPHLLVPAHVDQVPVHQREVGDVPHWRIGCRSQRGCRGAVGALRGWGCRAGCQDHPVGARLVSAVAPGDVAVAVPPGVQRCWRMRGRGGATISVAMPGRTWPRPNPLQVTLRDPAVLPPWVPPYPAPAEPAPHPAPHHGPAHSPRAPRQHPPATHHPPPPRPSPTSPARHPSPTTVTPSPAPSTHSLTPPAPPYLAERRGAPAQPWHRCPRGPFSWTWSANTSAGWPCHLRGSAAPWPPWRGPRKPAGRGTGGCWLWVPPSQPHRRGRRIRVGCRNASSPAAGSSAGCPGTPCPARVPGHPWVLPFAICRSSAVSASRLPLGVSPPPSAGWGEPHEPRPRAGVGTGVGTLMWAPPFGYPSPSIPSGAPPSWHRYLGALT